ncbi:MAG: hypothetical protein ACFFCW_25370, partial [Candidatus Hodarchaeota archaeon]
MKLRKIIILILILLILGLILWLLYWLKGPPKESPISLLNSHGQEVSKLNVLDTAAISVEKLEPSTHYDIRIIRSDGVEISHCRLTTDQHGLIPLTPILYDVGIEYERSSRIGRFNIEGVINYKYKIVVTRLREKFEIPFEIVDRKDQPQIFSADRNGNPLNGFIIGKEDIYVAGRNFPSGSSIRIYIVNDKYTWQDGDELIDVSGGYEIVNLESNQTGFKKLVWNKDSVKIGCYDIIADHMPQDGLYSETDTDPNDNDCNVGFCVQNDAGPNHIEQEVTCQEPSPPPPAAPNPIYRDSFSTSENVWVAVNPHTQGQNYVGMNARIYVVNHKPEANWTHGTALVDVSGGYETTVIQPGCANVNYTLIWPNPLTPGEYDVITDFAPFGVYDKGTDIVDMLDPIGLLVGDADIEVVRIKFNWGSGSGAANLKDHTTDSLVPAPEWDKTINCNEPASYVRGSTITIQAQFHKLSPTAPDNVVVWANVGRGVNLLPQTVNFGGADYSGYINFPSATPLPNYINKHDFVWQWYYAIPPYPGSVQNPMNVSTHTICATFDTPNADATPAYKKPM